MDFFKWLKRHLSSVVKTPRAGDDSKIIDPEFKGPFIPNHEDYTVWPPGTPQHIIAHRADYAGSVAARKFWCPRGQFQDSLTSAFYILYECFVLDKDIPDPKDPDPSRYAFLAGVTYLMVKSFNARVKLGLTRDAHPIMTMEEAEAAKQVPDEQRPYETISALADAAPAAAEPIRI